jgi:hypothetical protein
VAWSVPDRYTTTQHFTSGHQQLKGTQTRDFRPLFFSSNNSPSRPPVCYRYHISTAASLTPMCMSQQCQWHRCSCPSGALCSRVSFPFKKQCDELFAKIFEKKLVAERYQWHRCACHSYVNDSAVQVTAVSMTPLCYQFCRLSSRIRGHIRKGFNLCIRDPWEFVWWKKRSKISCQGSFRGKFILWKRVLLWIEASLFAKKWRFRIATNRAGKNDKWSCDAALLIPPWYRIYTQKIIEHYDKSRWLIGGDLLTDPATHDDRETGIWSTNLSLHYQRLL